MNEIQNENINQQDSNNNKHNEKSTLRTGFILSIVGVAIQMGLIIFIILFLYLQKTMLVNEPDLENAIKIIIIAIIIISLLILPVWIAIIILASKNLKHPESIKFCLTVGILSIIFGGVLGLVGGILILIEHKNT